MDEIEDAVKSQDIERLSVLMHEYHDRPLEYVKIRQALYEAVGQSDIWLAMIDRDFEPE